MQTYQLFDALTDLVRELTLLIREITVEIRAENAAYKKMAEGR